MEMYAGIIDDFELLIVTMWPYVQEWITHLDVYQILFMSEKHPDLFGIE